jgi:hypothetical protein
LLLQLHHQPLLLLMQRQLLTNQLLLLKPPSLLQLPMQLEAWPLLSKTQLPHLLTKQLAIWLTPTRKCLVWDLLLLKHKALLQVPLLLKMLRHQLLRLLTQLQVQPLPWIQRLQPLPMLLQVLTLW